VTLNQHPVQPQPGGLGEPEREVRVLHRLAGRALAEVVDRADHDRVPVAGPEDAISAASVPWTRASSGATPSGSTRTTG
jgi:hypothetical protein